MRSGPGITKGGARSSPERHWRSETPRDVAQITTAPSASALGARPEFPSLRLLRGGGASSSRRVWRDRAAESVFELDLRCPSEQLAGAGDVGLAYLRVVHRQGLVDHLAFRRRNADYSLGELVERELVRIADVDGKVL